MSFEPHLFMLILSFVSIGLISLSADRIRDRRALSDSRSFPGLVSVADSRVILSTLPEAPKEAVNVSANHTVFRKISRCTLRATLSQYRASTDRRQYCSTADDEFVNVSVFAEPR